MPLEDIAGLGLSMAALVTIIGALFVGRWQNVIAVAVLAYVVQAIFVTATFGVVSALVHDQARALGQFVALLLIGLLVYGVRRAIGAGWRRLRG